MRQHRQNSLNSFILPLQDQGQLTLSFRGSISELSVHLLARPNPQNKYLEGSSTTLDVRDKPTPLISSFYMAMHGLLTNNDQSAQKLPAAAPQNILGKMMTIHTRPARLENITGRAKDESISVWCTTEGAIHMRVIGQDLSFPSCSQSLIHHFAQTEESPAMQNITAHFVDLLQEYGTAITTRDKFPTHEQGF